MIKCKLKEKTSNSLILLYQPDGLGKFGKATFNEQGFHINEIAENDIVDSDYFTSKLMFKMEELLLKDSIPIEFNICWY